MTADYHHRTTGYNARIGSLLLLIPLDLISRSLLRFNPEQKIKYPVRLRRGFLFALSIFLVLIPAKTSLAQAKPASDESYPQMEKRLRSLISKGYVLVANDSKVLFRYETDKNLIPASILKIPTALASFDILGKDHQFKTEFYRTQNGDLIIRGRGDPYLVSEEWVKIVRKLRDYYSSNGLPFKIRHIYPDDSLFDAKSVDGVGRSSNPYDAMNGALATNFNTIHVRVNKNREITSAEQQTPITPLAFKLAKSLPAGKHRINISDKPENILRYVGELFREFITNEGFAVNGEIITSPQELSEALQQSQLKDSQSDLIYTHHNQQSLGETVIGMMEYSNNFIANQLVLAVGEKEFGYPVTLENGVTAIENYLNQKLGVSRKEFHLVEGSGISRQNQISAEAMWASLKKYLPYKHTLRQKDGVHLKSGTLTGVYSWAGYLPHKTENRYFVIVVNQKRNTRDRILELLKQEFSSSPI